MKSLDRHLRELRRGKVDSSGVFTVDPSKMKVKFGRIEASPGQSFLHLVQAGVKLGAQVIEVQIGAEVASVSYLGLHTEHFHRRRAEKLFAERIDAADPLTLGLCSAQATRIGLFWARGGKLVASESEGIRIENWPESGQQDCTVVLEREPSARDRAEESNLIRRRCGFCGVPVKVDQITVSWYDSPFYRGVAAQAEQYQPRDVLETGFALPGLAQRPTAALVVGGRILFTQADEPNVEMREYFLEEGELAYLEDGGRWGRAMLLPRRAEPESTVCFLRHGVITDVHQVPSLGWPGARALVCADRMKTDVGGLAIIRNSEYEAVLEEVRTRVAELAALEGKFRSLGYKKL